LTRRSRFPGRHIETPTVAGDQPRRHTEHISEIDLSMFVVKCPKCGGRSKAYSDHAGRHGECPHCKRKILIVAEEGEAPDESLRAIQPERRSSQPRRTSRQRLPDTSPSALLAASLAVVATWLFFKFGEGLFSTSWWQPLWATLRSCGWIGNVEVWLFFWGLFLAGRKTTLWLRQRRYLRRQVFPENITNGAKIRVANVDECLQHVERMAHRPRRSILLNRVCLALEHLRLTGHVGEVRGALTGQSAIDANLLDSSYTVLRFLVWVIPIVGFIGTVIGIGVAVNEFAGFIPEVAAVEEAMTNLREGLGQVTSGLGTAFNTTLVALCLAAPLMLVTSSLRKLEERLLAEIDHFSNHHLLGAFDNEEAPRSSSGTKQQAQTSGKG